MSSAAFRLTSVSMSKESLKSADGTDDERLLRPESDEALMARVCADDKEALACLFRRYAHIVRTIAYRVLRDISEADDVLQEVFLLVHRKCKTFEPSKGPVRPWILQVAYHHALCRRRHLTSRHFYTQVDIEDMGTDLRTAQNDSLGPTEAINAVVGKDGLGNAFDTLSDNQRQTLCLFFFEGYTLGEIAAKLKQPRGRVKNHYFRGLDRLRRQICGKSHRGPEDK
jgi:RNA polymerase sigma-70 factor (ECF subfamily)